MSSSYGSPRTRLHSRSVSAFKPQERSSSKARKKARNALVTQPDVERVVQQHLVIRACTRDTGSTPAMRERATTHAARTGVDCDGKRG